MRGNCPACGKTPLEPCADPDTQLEIDTCPECHGLWFDADELRSFYASRALKDQFMPSRTYKPGSHTFEITTKARRCPRCPKALARTQVGDIYVDVCSDCQGIWLDDGELDRITHLYKNQGLRGDERVASQVREGNKVKAKNSGALGEVLDTLGSLFQSILSTRLK